MSPEINQSEISFHKLNEYQFEDMCRDLLDTEPNIATCDTYGVRGQPQEGIDLLAYRNDGDGIEVGQCKCYKDFPPAKIREASDKFFEYWEKHWSKKNVRRFILFVACDLDKRQRQNEITKQKERFTKVGVNYEAWSKATIRNKLRAHPGIVATYLSPSDYWVQMICGQIPSNSPWIYEKTQQTNAIVNTAPLSQLEHLMVHISAEHQKKLGTMLVAFHQGRKTEVIAWVQKLKSDQILWTTLAREFKAELLCLEAKLALSEPNNLHNVKQLVKESKQFAPSKNQNRLQALILYLEGKQNDAIKQFEGQTDIDSLNLKATFLLGMGKIDDCQAILDFENASFKPNAETFRIRALSYLISKNLNQAHLEIQKALELEPRWYTIRFVAAMLNYFSALSPAALPKQLVPWPEPVEWDLIKRGNASFTYLRKAEQIFQELLENSEIGERQFIEIWRLACLANDDEKQPEALQYCQAILQTNPAHSLAIIWAYAHHFEINLKPSKKALQILIAQKKATNLHIIALIICYFLSKKIKKAIHLLEETESIFQQEQSITLWHFWHIHLLVLDEKPEVAMAAIENSTFQSTEELQYAKSFTLQAIAKRNKDWQSLVQSLEKSYKDTQNPIFLIDCCKLMAEQQKWDYIAEHAKQLIEKIGTSEAVRLAIIGTYNAKQYARSLELLNEYQGFFKQRKLPNQLRQLKINCQCSLGILPKAVIEAEKLANDDPTTQNLIYLAEVYFIKGDIKNIAIVARKLRDCPDITTKQLLKIARWIRLEDQPLAQFLWKRATNIADEDVITAYKLGHELGLEKELEELTRRMMQLGHEKRAGIEALTFDETISLIKQQREHGAKIFEIYHDGNIPIHIIVDELNQLIVTFYHEILQKNETNSNSKGRFVLLARHGGRVLNEGFPDNQSKWRLNLDITAILLAAHLDILNEVENAFQPLRIPAKLMQALLLMQNKSNSFQATSWLNNLINQLRQGIDNGIYEIIPTKTTNEIRSDTLNYEVLKSLLDLEAHKNDVIWVDDRYLNGYSHSGTIPIIGINEILKALVATKSLTISQYYAKLTQLRAANIRYIPIEKNEIIYHLQQAKIENHEILETQELSILRRYIAACLLESDKLQRPPMPENSSDQNGEIAFLFTFNRAVITALVDLWRIETDEKVCQIRAEWIITNLYIDYIDLFNVTQISKNNQDDLYLLAISLSGLLSYAYAFQPRLKKEANPIRHQYFEWVFTRILQKRFKGNPNLLTTFVEFVKTNFFLSILEDKEIGDKDIRTFLVNKFYQDLPKTIQNELRRDTHFMGLIGISSINTIKIDDLSFKSEDFGWAAKKAINGYQATIVELDNNLNVTFSPLEKHDGNEVYYNHPNTNKKTIITGGLEILLESPTKRESVLQKNRHWFDCSDKSFKQAVAELASMEDVQQRLKKMESWQNSSAAVYYLELPNKIIENQICQFSDFLPPSAEGLLRHFRITQKMAKTDKFSDIFATITQQLIDEEKLIDAMERIIALPVSLPLSLKNAVAKLSSEKKRALVKKIIKTNSAPLSKIHFVHLLLNDNSPAYQRLARRIIKNLFSKQGSQEIESFLLFLRWINEKLSHWFSDCSPSIRLAMVWAHAHRLFSIFMSLQLPLDWFHKTFNQPTQHLQLEIFKYEFEYRFDIAHPNFVEKDTFLMAGIAYGIGKKAIDEKLQNIFLNTVFIEIKGERFPNPLFLRDTSRASNGLCSFLGGSFGKKLIPLLGNDNVKLFTQSSIKSFLEEILNKLVETPNDLSTWLQLYLVFGYLPANKNFVAQFKVIILQTNFTKLLEQNVSKGHFVMKMTSLQIAHFQDENLQLYLKQQFFNNLKFLTNQEFDELSLIESAFNLSLARQPADKAIAEFVGIVTQLIETCHSLIPMCKLIIQRFCEELPVSQSQQFWRLLVRLRTE